MKKELNEQLRKLKKRYKLSHNLYELDLIDYDELLAKVPTVEEQSRRLASRAKYFAQQAHKMGGYYS